MPLPKITLHLPKADQIALWKEALMENIQGAKHYEGKDKAAYDYYIARITELRRILNNAGEMV
jgi:hypothetical protein